MPQTAKAELELTSTDFPTLKAALVIRFPYGLAHHHQINLSLPQSLLPAVNPVEILIAPVVLA